METRVGGLEMKADKEQQTSASDAFISYSRRDMGFASKMVENLEAYKPPRDLNLVEERDPRRR